MKWVFGVACKNALALVVLALAAMALPAELSAQSSGLVADSATVRELMQSVRPRLPKGWTLSYNGERSQIEARCLGKGSRNSEDSVDRFYQIAVEVRPLISREMHRAEKAKYEESLRSLQSVEEKLGKQFGLWVKDKDGYYRSESAEDKELVDKYNQLRDSLLDCSNYYYKNLSIYWTPSYYGKRPDNPELDAEIENARSAFIFALKQYQHYY